MHLLHVLTIVAFILALGSLIFNFILLRKVNSLKVMVLGEDPLQDMMHDINSSTDIEHLKILLTYAQKDIDSFEQQILDANQSPDAKRILAMQAGSLQMTISEYTVQRRQQLYELKTLINQRISKLSVVTQLNS